MHKVKSTHLHLREKIVENFGRQILSLRDCEELSEKLVQNFNAQISPQTLRRFFGLVKSESSFSIYTLNLLANFCGYQDYEAFRISFEYSELEIFFGDVEDPEKDYWRKSEELCIRIMGSADMLVSTHHRFMTFPTARKFFMEHHPLRDMLGTVYTQYFLAYLKFNTSAENKIFAYGFLFKSAFLQQNLELLELYFAKVKEVEFSANIHVIPAALRFGTILLYADITENEGLFIQTFSEMKVARELYIEASKKSVCSFEYTVLESLIFTNRLNEIQFLLENHTPQIWDDAYFVPQDRKESHDEVWKILSAISHQKLGNVVEMQSILNSINLDKLGVGWRKYYSILYKFLLVQYLDGEEKATCTTELQELIQKSYFFYFQDKLDNYLTTERLAFN